MKRLSVGCVLSLVLCSCGCQIRSLFRYGIESRLEQAGPPAPLTRPEGKIIPFPRSNPPCLERGTAAPPLLQPQELPKQIEQKGKAPQKLNPDVRVV